MATEAELKAAAKRAYAAGDIPAAKRLIAAARAAGEQALASQSSPPSKPADDGPAAPPRALTPQEEKQKAIDDFALFEMANPALKGQYKPGDKLPKPGSTVGGNQGNARAVKTVQPWREADVRAASRDTFGDTASEMMAGPIAGMKAFGAGIADSSQSPSMAFMNQDPATSWLPDVVKVPISKITDTGMAGLSAVGAGMAGAAGIGAEFVPGQGPADERKFAGDVLEMSQFAVPELAGVSSVAPKMATVAPKVSAGIEGASKLAGDVAAAKKLGIPVYRSDVKPPQSFVGSVVKKAGEGIPIAGTGGMAAKQNAARIEAAQSFAREFGGDALASAIDDVAAKLIEKRSTDIKKYTTQKNEVIDRLDASGAVETPKAAAAIDDQIATIARGTKEVADQVIPVLRQWKNDLTGKTLKEIELIRKQVGEKFTALDPSAGRSTGQKAVSDIYGPLREDMGNFIRTQGGTTDLNKWGSANARLSEMADELGNTALKRALSKGDATPEAVRSLLFSNKPSDVKLLYRSLSEDGRASARTAVVQEAIEKAGGSLEDLSPDKFKNALAKLGSQVGVFFKGDDLEAADGLLRALKLTEGAGKAAAAPLTGVQNMPAAIGILVSSFFGGSIPATAAALGGIGGIARMYEATGVRSALRALAKAETPTARNAAIRDLGAKLSGIAPKVAAPAAGQEASKPYDSLWGKY